ncbi:hypothetical protein AC478_00170 [miscellaneous Crenarchaeota group-1 archaeon SG8-32-3]|uniref:DUF1015 domain-containing protein n=1 Tax=miscellaneous Crenarchaeota group-1 archaeon SG8-32-3 TaxID=1685125 RepID=A0A0M0BVV4_9ARCH|nr:MAG: hypothetical protein AC478_00170 [miscellaneous Crenarchaeota group-1 archaeon SG8-32-3]
MVDIRPFRAIHYTEKAGDPANLITQPYDKITPELQIDYYSKSVYNYCRLILPIENNKYEAAQQRIQIWLNEGILSKDEEPVIFVSKQEFKVSGKNCTRIGLIAALRLYSYGENMVFPHEVTYKKPKTDRLNILRAVQKDLEPVFLIYSDPENVTVDFLAEITKTKPAVEIEDSFGVKHAIWSVIDPKKLKFMRKVMKDKKLVITDGHHRYESALAYRDEMREKNNWLEDNAFNFHMCYMVPVQEEGLVVLPTHRLLTASELTEDTLKALECFFTISEVTPTVEALESFLKSHKEERAFCIYDGSHAYGLLLKDEKTVSELIDADCPREACLVDVVILRDVVFRQVLKVGELKMDEHILYAESTRSALEKVDSGQAKLAFLVNPVNPETVWQIAQKNWRLPEKSTDFYPKPVSGLTMMDISPEEML